MPIPLAAARLYARPHRCRRWTVKSFFVRRESDAAVEASCVVSELIAKAGKQFTVRRFLKDCMLWAAHILCPEKASLFQSLSANTIGERISEFIRWHLWSAAHQRLRGFSAYSLALNDRIDRNDTAQLAIFVRGINDQFKVTEELLSLCPMRGEDHR